MQAKLHCGASRRQDNEPRCEQPTKKEKVSKKNESKRSRLQEARKKQNSEKTNIKCAIGWWTIEWNELCACASALKVNYVFRINIFCFVHFHSLIFLTNLHFLLHSVSFSHFKWTTTKGNGLGNSSRRLSNSAKSFAETPIVHQLVDEKYDSVSQLVAFDYFQNWPTSCSARWPNNNRTMG